jgi:hypothetical protein
MGNPFRGAHFFISVFYRVAIVLILFIRIIIKFKITIAIRYLLTK